MLDKNDLQRSDHDRQSFDSLPRPHWLDAATGPKLSDTDPDYIAPSLFSHTLNVNQPIHKIFRSRDLADKIMESYWVRIFRAFYFPFFTMIESQDIVQRRNPLLPWRRDRTDPEMCVGACPSRRLRGL